MDYIAIVINEIPGVLKPIYVLEAMFDPDNGPLKEQVLEFISQEYDSFDEEKVMQQFDSYILLLPVEDVGFHHEITLHLTIDFEDGPDLSTKIAALESGLLQVKPSITTAVKQTRREESNNSIRHGM
jgi:hypothetical protein